MTLKTYRLPIACGAAFFFAQIGVSAYSQANTLTAKAQSLAAQAITAILASPDLLAWLFLYLALGVASHAWALSVPVKMVRDLQGSRTESIARFYRKPGIALLAGLLTAAALLAWNASIFPSGFTAEYRTDTPEWLPLAFALLISAPIILLGAHWLLRAASRTAKVSLALLIAVAALAGASTHPIASAPLTAQPNIVLIGIDSLRPDHLEMFGAPKALAPTMESFIQSGITFDNAYTPQARTFVAHMSLLSGKYPVSNGVRENLYPRKEFDRRELLSQKLRSAGYTTIFGLDEVRFANIDESFGFDQIASPKHGVFEFAIGTIYSSAGTNLLQLVPGAWRILPHTAGNLALKAGYYPSNQNARLDDAIQKAPQNRPLFLIAHFCMAHVPFATGPLSTEPLGGAYADSPLGYQKALTVVDVQVRETLKSLRDANRLDNALVIFFSDHGEGLGMKKDEWTYVPSPTVPKPNLPADFGHGINAMEDGQTRILISMQRFISGRPAWNATRTIAPASLIDIFPTVMEIGAIDYTRSATDGVPLMTTDGLVSAPQSRPIFVESGLSGKTLQESHLDETEIANEFAYLFRLTEDLRFELLPDAIPEQLKLKQRGVLLGDMGVAHMPRAASNGGSCWLVSNFSTRERTCIKDVRSHPEAQRLAALVCEHFRRDIDFYKSQCSPTEGFVSQPGKAELH